MGLCGSFFRGRSCLAITLALGTLVLAGCETSPYSDATSRWETLRTAKKVKCDPIGKSDQHLDYTSLQKSDDKGFALVAQGRARNGTPEFNIMPLSDDTSVDVEKLTPFVVSSKDVLLGTYVANQVVHGVFYAGYKQPGELQVRKLTDNTVIYHREWQPTKEAFSTLIGTGLVVNKEGFFLSYKYVPVDESAEDQPTRVMYAQFAERNLLNLKPSAIDKVGPKAVMVALSNPKKVLVIWNAAQQRQAASQFMAIEYDQENAVPVPVGLRVATKGPVETWSVRSFGDRLLFSLVEGDSLLGEARLRFIGFDWRPVGAKVAWNYSAEIGNAHVGDSFVLSTKKNPSFIVSKWLDRESTLMLYEPGAEGRVYAQAYGVFPEGTTLLDVWQRDGSDQAFALLRTQKGYVKEYLMCALSI